MSETFNEAMTINMKDFLSTCDAFTYRKYIQAVLIHLAYCQRRNEDPNNHDLSVKIRMLFYFIVTGIQEECGKYLDIDRIRSECMQNLPEQIKRFETGDMDDLILTAYNFARDPEIGKTLIQYLETVPVRYYFDLLILLYVTENCFPEEIEQRILDLTEDQKQYAEIFRVPDDLRSRERIVIYRSGDIGEDPRDRLSWTTVQSIAELYRKMKDRELIHTGEIAGDQIIAFDRLNQEIIQHRSVRLRYTRWI